MSGCNVTGGPTLGAGAIERGVVIVLTVENCG